MLHQDTYFVISVKLNFYQGQTHCIDDQDKFVKDTNNELNECQTPNKKLQSIGISPVSLHAFMKTLTLFRIGGWWGQKGPHQQFFPCNFYKRRNQPPNPSDFQFQPFWHTGVKFQICALYQSQIIEIQPRPPLKKSTFSGQILIKLRLL